MSTDCQLQAYFSFRDDREIVIDSAAGPICTDTGLIGLREFDHRIAFTNQLVERIDDDRHDSYVIHQLPELTIQRLYGLVAGYEDQNDADRLRYDGLFQIIAGKDVGELLASQPSLSRFENSVSAREVGALNELLVETFIQNHSRPPLIIVELDSTDDPTHGQQQLSGFNGFYNQHMYHPLLIHEGVTGCILGTFLRPGQAHSAESALIALRPIVGRLKQAFPHTLLLLRADCGFATPELYDFCEANDIGFTIAIAANQVLKRRSDRLLQQAREQYEVTGSKAKCYGHFLYQANSWPHQRRILAKVEAASAGCNRRFVVTNRPGAAQCLFDFYEGRGQAENYIKELKNQLKADRLSSPRFAANCFRLVLTALAYQLLNLFRRRLSNPQLRTAQIQTLRNKVFKVGALIRQTTRRIWLHMAAGWPHQKLLQQVLRDVCTHPPPA